MRKILLALLVCFVLIGCQPAEKAPEAKETVTPPTQPQQVQETTEPAITEPEAAEPEPAAVATPEALPTGVNLQTACDKLVTIDEFASICGIDAARVTTTAKASDKTCWVTFVDRQARSYTAGFTTVDWIETE